MRSLFISLMVLGAYSSMSSTAMADDSIMNLAVDPPQPVHRESKDVRMKAERIRLYFSWDETRVEAEFDLENLTDSRRMLTAGFPDDALVRAYMESLTAEEASERGISLDYSSFTFLDEVDVKPYRDFTTWVGTPENIVKGTVYKFENREETVKLVSEEISPNAEWSSQWGSGGVTLWHCFDLRWQPRETITVGHSYTADNGWHSVGCGQPFYYYLLATGANWAGTIGRAEVDLYLEGGMRVEDLALGDPPCVGYDDANPKLDGWEVVSRTHLRLVWEDFDPVEGKAYIKVLAQTAGELVNAGRHIEGSLTWEEAVEAGIVEPRF